MGRVPNSLVPLELDFRAAGFYNVINGMCQPSLRPTVVACGSIPRLTTGRVITGPGSGVAVDSQTGLVYVITWGAKILPLLIIG